MLGTDAHGLKKWERRDETNCQHSDPHLAVQMPGRMFTTLCPESNHISLLMMFLCFVGTEIAHSTKSGPMVLCDVSPPYLKMPTLGPQGIASFACGLKSFSEVGSGTCSVWGCVSCN